MIPFLHIADDANTLKALPENLLKIDIPPVMNVMTALVLAALIGLATAWVKSDEISKLLDTFQKMVLELVKRVLLPVLPVFIAANFCILSYQGAVTKLRINTIILMRTVHGKRMKPLRTTTIFILLMKTASCRQTNG